jgi:DNA-binding PadR family transcriptional regulator
MTIRGLHYMVEITEKGRANREELRKRSFALYRELAQIEPLDYEDEVQHAAHMAQMQDLWGKANSKEPWWAGIFEEQDGTYGAGWCRDRCIEADNYLAARADRILALTREDRAELARKREMRRLSEAADAVWRNRPVRFIEKMDHDRMVAQP